MFEKSPRNAYAVIFVYSQNKELLTVCFLDLAPPRYPERKICGSTRYIHSNISQNSKKQRKKTQNLENHGIFFRYYQIHYIDFTPIL